MTTQANLVKYAGALFSVVPGAYLQSDLVPLDGALGGDLRTLMKTLSEIPAWRALHSGTDAEVAHELMDRLVGDTAAATDKAWAVQWMLDARAAGSGWGEIMYVAVSTLDAVQTGPWAYAGAQLRARADYALAASTGWASDVVDLGVLRDVYAFAADMPAAGIVQPTRTVLGAIAQALDSGAAQVNVHAAAENYVVSAADQGKAVFLGAGDDRVTVDWDYATKPAFLSGGDGVDTLSLTNPAGTGYGAWMMTYQLAPTYLPYRGFEIIEFVKHTPAIVVPMEDVEMVMLGTRDNNGYRSGFSTQIMSANEGMTVALNLTGARDNTVNFKSFVPGAAAGDFVFSKTPPQILDNLHFKLVADAGSTLSGVYLSNIPARHVSFDLAAADGKGEQFGVFLSERKVLMADAPLPNLESMTIRGTGSFYAEEYLKPPVLSSIDMSQLAGTAKIRLSLDGARVTDGTLDSVTIRPPQGVVGLIVDVNGVKADSYPVIQGELTAGSSLYVNYRQVEHAAGVKPLQVVFNGDMSDLDHWSKDGIGLNGILFFNPVGSVFDVRGMAGTIPAAYFKGTPPAGKTLGSVVMEGEQQQQIVKTGAGGAAIDLVAEFNIYGLTTVINNGSTSVLEANLADLVTYGTSKGFQVKTMNIDGGRIAFVDTNADGVLTAPKPASWLPHGMLSDLVVMETSNADLARFNQSLELLGFNPVVDPFL